MRKITEKACEAFYSNAPYKNSNTEVNVSNDEKLTELYLHGNLIATRLDDNVNITLAGWNTNTTRERLNGLKGVRVSTKLGQAYLNGEKWNGEWVTVTPAGKVIK